VGIVIGILVMVGLSFPIFKEIVYPMYKEREAQKNIENKVSWICARTLLGRDKELYEYIDEWQHEISIEDKYRVTLDIYDSTEEYNIVVDILSEFQQDVSRSFFSSSLKKEKVFLELREKEYFLISLLQFLNSNIECNSSIISKKIHRPHSPEFSEFGKVYLKLCYIVNLICENYDELSICSMYDSFGKFDKFIHGNSINVKKHIDSLNEEK
jgi:hypothetical protein